MLSHPNSFLDNPGGCYGAEFLAGSKYISIDHFSHLTS
jgi:hypothetical protein